MYAEMEDVGPRRRTLLIESMVALTCKHLSGIKAIPDLRRTLISINIRGHRLQALEQKILKTVMMVEVVFVPASPPDLSLTLSTADGSPKGRLNHRLYCWTILYKLPIYSCTGGSNPAPLLSTPRSRRNCSKSLLLCGRCRSRLFPPSLSSPSPGASPPVSSL